MRDIRCESSVLVLFLLSSDSTSSIFFSFFLFLKNCLRNINDQEHSDSTSQCRKVGYRQRIQGSASGSDYGSCYAHAQSFYDERLVLHACRRVLMVLLMTVFKSHSSSMALVLDSVGPGKKVIFTAGLSFETEWHHQERRVYFSDYIHCPMPSHIWKSIIQFTECGSQNHQRPVSWHILSLPHDRSFQPTQIVV